MNKGERKFCEYQDRLAGSFYTALFDAMIIADVVNMVKLAQGFPEETKAVERYQNESGYWEKLEAEWKSDTKRQS